MFKFIRGVIAIIGKSGIKFGCKILNGHAFVMFLFEINYGIPKVIFIWSLLWCPKGLF